MATDEEEFRKYVEGLYEKFDKLCLMRHETGQVEYGEFTFLDNDLIRMMLEELADTINYAKMHAIKLLMLAEQMEAESAAENNKPQIGFQAFKGTGEIGWDKS